MLWPPFSQRYLLLSSFAQGSFHSFVRPLPPVIIANAPAICRVERGESLFLLGFPRKSTTGQFHPIYNLVLDLDLPSLPPSSPPPSTNVPIIPHSLVLVSNQLRHNWLIHTTLFFFDLTAPLLCYAIPYCYIHSYIPYHNCPADPRVSLTNTLSFEKPGL